MLDQWLSTGFTFHLDLVTHVKPSGARFVVLADTNMGALVFDASNPSNLGIPIAYYAESTGAFGLKIHRERLYVAAGSGGLRIYQP